MFTSLVVCVAFIVVIALLMYEAVRTMPPEVNEHTTAYGAMQQVRNTELFPPESTNYTTAAYAGVEQDESSELSPTLPKLWQYILKRERQHGVALGEVSGYRRGMAAGMMGAEVLKATNDTDSVMKRLFAAACDRRSVASN